MPSNRPSLEALHQQVVGDFNAHSQGDAANKGSLDFALANVVAGVAHGLYGRMDFMMQQLFDSTATEGYLLKRAAEFGLFLIAGFRAQGQAVFTGSNGKTVPKGLVLKHGDFLFVTTASATIGGGEATVAIRAVDVGSAQNLGAGEALVLQQAIDGIDSNALVTSLAGGADTETLERFKQRFAERKAQPPAGGNDHDYVAWAKQAHPDVTRVWVIRNGNGPGTVRVLIMCDGLPNPVPPAPILNAVTAFIDQPHIRPAGMKGFTVEAPSLTTQAVTFTALTPNTQAVRDAIAAQLADFFDREGGLGQTVYVHRLRSAISRAPGLLDYSDNITGNITPAADMLPVLGGITWPTP